MTSIPEETPEEHVHESVGRQAKAAADVKTIAKKVARTADGKAHILAVATEVLSARVGSLADAVQMNNRKMDDFAKELNRKPDDAEIRFISGLAATERNRHLRYALATALSSSFVAGYIAFNIADRQGEMRCETNARNIETLVSIIDTPELRGLYKEEIRDLRSNRNVCL